ncbi:hypothetical protein ACNKHT_14600 [Shigella flexneri]
MLKKTVVWKATACAIWPTGHNKETDVDPPKGEDITLFSRLTYWGCTTHLRRSGRL